MKTSILSILMTLLMTGVAIADVYMPPSGSEITAASRPGSATVCWSGFSVAYLERYRTEPTPGGIWIEQIQPQGNCASFIPEEGDRFQLVSPEGRYLNIPKARAARVTYRLKGVVVERFAHEDPCLQLSR